MSNQFIVRACLDKYGEARMNIVHIAYRYVLDEIH